MYTNTYDFSQRCMPSSIQAVTLLHNNHTLDYAKFDNAMTSYGHVLATSTLPDVTYLTNIRTYHSVLRSCIRALRAYLPLTHQLALVTHVPVILASIPENIPLHASLPLYDLIYINEHPDASSLYSLLFLWLQDTTTIKSNVTLPVAY